MHLRESVSSMFAFISCFFNPLYLYPYFGHPKCVELGVPSAYQIRMLPLSNSVLAARFHYETLAAGQIRLFGLVRRLIVE